MNPSAIEGVEVVSDGEAGITLRHPQRGEVQLRGVAAAVWRSADGNRSVADLAAAAGVEESSVWAALDELGDADLLRERVTPPAGIHENVTREVVFAGEAAADERSEAEKLEARFDAEAARGEEELKLPAAEQRRKEQQGAAQDAEEKAASDAALELLDNRPADEAAAAEVSAEELAAQSAEEKHKSDRLAEEVAEQEAEDAKAAPEEAEVQRHEMEKKKETAD